MDEYPKDFSGLSMMHKNVCLGGILLLLLMVNTVGCKTSPERPNILIILADDLGYSDIGAYGGEIQTPHLDTLATNGVRFRQFYNTGRCCPTRASLLTGRYPHGAGMGAMVSVWAAVSYTHLTLPTTPYV